LVGCFFSSSSLSDLLTKPLIVGFLLLLLLLLKKKKKEKGPAEDYLKQVKERKSFPSLSSLVWFFVCWDFFLGVSSRRESL